MMQKPDVEHIDGLSPAISIEQKTTSRNPRSTVATVTEIYDYMRLLWARVGVPYSPATGLPITAQTCQQMVDRSWPARGHAALPARAGVRGARASTARNSPSGRRPATPACASTARCTRSKTRPALDKKYKHDIEVVVDRLAVREGIETRLADSFEQALITGRGAGLCRSRRGHRAGPRGRAGRQRQRYGRGDERHGLPPNRIVFFGKVRLPGLGLHARIDRAAVVLVQRADGRLPGLRRAGEKLLFDPQMVVPNEALTLKQGAIVPWAKSNPPSPYYMQVLASLAKAYGFDLTTPWQDLPAKRRARSCSAPRASRCR
jgi:excinuclease ABC subunit A